MCRAWPIVGYSASLMSFTHGCQFSREPQLTTSSSLRALRTRDVKSPLHEKQSQSLGRCIACKKPKHEMESWEERPKDDLKLPCLGKRQTALAALVHSSSIETFQIQ
eukprot:3776072-Amphidinium_carterae.2